MPRDRTPWELLIFAGVLFSPVVAAAHGYITPSTALFIGAIIFGIGLSALKLTVWRREDAA